MRVLFPAVLLALLAAGCTGAVSDPFSVDEEWDLFPGGFAEVNVKMVAGDSFAGNFTATGGNVTWDVHSHDDGEVVTHDSGEGASGSFEFEAGKAGTYSFFAENPAGGGRRIALHVLMSGTGTIHSVL